MRVEAGREGLAGDEERGLKFFGQSLKHIPTAKRKLGRDRPPNSILSPAYTAIVALSPLVNSTARTLIAERTM